MLVVGVTVVSAGASAYSVVQEPFPGVTSAMTAALVELVFVLSGCLAVGSLVRVAFATRRRGRTALRLGDRETALPMWSGLVWLVSSGLMIFVSAADEVGLPISTVFRGGSLRTIIGGGYGPASYAVAGVCALIVAVVAFVAVRWEAVVIAAAIGCFGLLAPVLSGQVLVGPNHDFAGDASMFGTPALAVLLGVAIAASVDPRVLHEVRARWIAVVAGAVAVATDAVVLAVELAGKSPFAVPTGWIYMAKTALVVVAVVVLAVRSRTPGAPPSRARWIVAAALAIVAGGFVVAATRIPPPVYFVPTTISQNFLGFNVDPAPSLATLAGYWRPNILFLVISLLGIGLYLAAVIRLRRRGDRWPLGRTIAWVLGWIVVILTTSSGVGRYSGASFSVHMGLHMSLNMLAPMLLVLGGVITLALRATTAHGPAETAGPHEWIKAFMESPLVRLSYNPLYIFVVFTGSYYALYFTPIFENSMRFHWAHQLLNVHFIVIGYFFYGLIIGVDTPPRSLPHIGKLGLVLAAMPFHAFFGVVVMTSSKDVIAKTFYEYLHLPWMNLGSDQQLGGGIAWSAGELPLMIVVIALITQWSRQDSKLAARTDRHLDQGLDTSFDAYNEMLESLSRRDTAPATPAAAPGGSATAAAPADGSPS